jgi:hypothetical protein
MANRTNDCAGVCAEVRERLVKEGLIGPEVVKHGPVYAALDKVVFVTKEDLGLLVSGNPDFRELMKKYL